MSYLNNTIIFELHTTVIPITLIELTVLDPTQTKHHLSPSHKRGGRFETVEMELRGEDSLCTGCRNIFAANEAIDTLHIGGTIDIERSRGDLEKSWRAGCRFCHVLLEATTLTTPRAEKVRSNVSMKRPTDDEWPYLFQFSNEKEKKRSIQITAKKTGNPDEELAGIGYLYPSADKGMLKIRQNAPAGVDT